MTRTTNKHGYDVYNVLPESMYSKKMKKVDRTDLYLSITFGAILTLALASLL